MLRYLEVALGLLRCESTNTAFTMKLLELAAVILIGTSSPHLFQIFSEIWIYTLVRVVARVPGCWYKKNKMVIMALEILFVICQHRTTMQILQFLKYFKNFITENDFSHINFDERLMNYTFKNLFSSI